MHAKTPTIAKIIEPTAIGCIISIIVLFFKKIIFIFNIKIIIEW